MRFTMPSSYQVAICSLLLTSAFRGQSVIEETALQLLVQVGISAILFSPFDTMPPSKYASMPACRLPLRVAFGCSFTARWSRESVLEPHLHGTCSISCFQGPNLGHRDWYQEHAACQFILGVIGTTSIFFCDREFFKQA
ncbi:hypothetical protein C8R43DRAFT_597406 [Mycena crocata]|nr:hypothetical protein C8R43DRAFT_597406 [Mycena crocata]